MGDNIGKTLHDNLLTRHQATSERTESNGATLPQSDVLALEERQQSMEHVLVVLAELPMKHTRVIKTRSKMARETRF